MYTEVDVFVSNFTLIDPEIYQLWIEGCSSSEAVSTLNQRAVAKNTGATVDLIASDVLDHYRTFALLERLLTVPSKLSEQMIFQIDEPTKQMLIEKYYDLDDAVIRELLGRKLSSRHRKDLDEVAERSGAPLRCCRRQFDNVRRVFKAVEEMPGNVVANIRATFLISEPLAKKYGAVVFIACMRFETAKRKLQYLSFNDFYHCAQAIMASWTYSCTGPEYYDTEMDREFLLELRELRILLDKEKEHKHLICMRLKPKLLEKSYQELELNFRLYTRALVGVACNLHRGRELRSLFIDLLERCIEPLRLGCWPRTDLAQFLCAYEQCALQMDVLRFRSDFEEFKCKMRIFGESLSLCRCIADDFQKKLTYMEKRLENLEKRQMLTSESNYSAIIWKNKRISGKIQMEAKKLQMCGTEEEMREVAARICRNYLHGAWKSVEPSALEFRRISGGLSNFLYYVALPEDSSKLGGFSRAHSPETEPEPVAARLARQSLARCSSFCMDEPRKVLLRIYGQVHGERAMDAIVTESVIFTLLSERRLGPKLHGVFSGGRIEEYIPARALLTKELSEPALSMKIAEKMAAIHSMDVPLSKEPNWLWKTMGKWVKTVREERLHPQAAGKTEDEQLIIKRFKSVDLEKEIEWLKKFIATVDSPVVFCHNDMQEGNILLLEDAAPTAAEDDVYYETASPADTTHAQTLALSQLEDNDTSDSATSRISDIGEPKLVLIDFEYCAYNYRGFDIANHFQEWGYDYTNPEPPFYYEDMENCPTIHQKEIFIKEYLKHYLANISEDKEPQEPSIEAVNQLLSEVDAFALASHLFWCLWSLVNASKSRIPFGYWEYALSRLETYLRLKQEVVKDKGFPVKRKICEVDI